ncbi:hypothetical protein SB461_32295, partial [Burkholderia cenocepacia]
MKFIDQTLTRILIFVVFCNYFENLGLSSVCTRETLINRQTRKLVGRADAQIPDAEVNRSEFGEVCPGKAPHF